MILSLFIYLPYCSWNNASHKNLSQKQVLPTSKTTLLEHVMCEARQSSGADDLLLRDTVFTVHAEFQHLKACDTMMNVSIWDVADKFTHQKHIQPLSMNRKNCLYESCVKHSTQSKCFPMLFHSVILSPSAGRIMEASCSVQILNILMYESTLSCYKGQSTSLKPKHMLRGYSATDLLNNKTLNTGCICSQTIKKWSL